MNLDWKNRTVAGERVGDLLPILRAIEWHDEPDGMRSFTFEAPVKEAAPFQRAIMRLDAELLVADADRLAPGNTKLRTDEQRRCDAFVELAVRVGEAVTGEPRVSRR